MKESAVIKIVLSSIKKKMGAKLKFFSNVEDGKGMGWEKWVQMELGYELKINHDAEVEFEFPCVYDKRKKIPHGKTNNNKGFIDLQYRRKNHEKELYTAVEIKMSASPKGIRPALGDLSKVRAFKDSNWNFRAVYAVVFIKENEYKNTKYQSLVTELKKNKDVVKAEIKWPGFTGLIMGWEAPPRKARDPEGFNKWLDSTRNLYKDNAGKSLGPKVNSRRKNA